MRQFVGGTIYDTDTATVVAVRTGLNGADAGDIRTTWAVYQTPCGEFFEVEQSTSQSPWFEDTTIVLMTREAAGERVAHIRQQNIPHTDWPDNDQPGKLVADRLNAAFSRILRPLAGLLPRH
jgi:hypothetical protein